MDSLNMENQLDENTKLLILKMGKEIESKDKEINNFKNELAYLKGQILNKNKNIFGQSSEQVDSIQISIFDEAENNSDPKAIEPTIEEITYKRSKSTKNIGKKDTLAHLERKIIEHKLEETDAVCNKCDSPLVAIGSKSKDVLKYIPAKLYIEELITYSYACKPCEATDGIANIVTAKAPRTLLYKGMASNELLAHILNLKYHHALPLYRQESYFRMLGANLSRQNLSNWTIAAASEFGVVYDIMQEELLKTHYIQADETTLKVIEAKGKESKSKKYMWLYKSAGSKSPIILYDYQKTRAGSCPKYFLKGFSGYLQTDGYSGYNSVENIKRFYCLAHIRRKYHEIIVHLYEESLKKSHAIIGFNYCEKLYKIEKYLRIEYSNHEDYYKNRYEIRLKESAPILEEFIDYVEREIKDALPRSPLGQALQYSRKLLPNMKTFLEDGSLEIDNNGAERTIKPFVIGRKNWLFSSSSKGAKASASIYSIIETAKSNGLIVEKYLVYLIDTLSNIEIKNRDTLIDAMPWSNELPNELKVQNRK
ncbi:IS66 family transposase [Clostridium gasigenes]|uniref:IS66 family transposase n=1 Tax=Clostridium gasigenes TaxID=94869 RepID=UPI001C0D992F|nr:IS66 family transposase [Clostridium gasigenes]MBU3090180.1 IS66 family transposase [Clostridium gasigenes]